MTALNATDGRIDHKHTFRLSDAKNLSLEIGCVVKYLARKIAEDEPIRIIEIKSIDSDCWNDGDTVDDVIDELKHTNPMLFTQRERNLNGVILNKIGGKIVLKLHDYSNEIEVYIDRVKTNFQPMKGDEICALACVQTDATKHDYLGAILNFIEIKPLSYRTIEGEIQRLPDGVTKHGLVDDEYVFFANALDNADNYERKPTVGDQIIAEVISGSHKFGFREFNWRCIKIIHRSKKERSQLMEKEEKHVDNNAEGIFITPSVELTISLGRLNDDKLLKINIENQTMDMRRLLKTELLDPFSKIEITSPAQHQPVNLEPTQVFQVTLKVCGRFFGVAFERIEFTFDNGAKVVRMIEISVDSQLKLENDFDGFYSNERNFQYTKSLMMRQGNLLRGEKVKQAPNFVEVKLIAFEVPKFLAEIVFSSADMDVVEDQLQAELCSNNVKIKR